MWEDARTSLYPLIHTTEQDMLIASSPFSPPYPFFASISPSHLYFQNMCVRSAVTLMPPPGPRSKRLARVYHHLQLQLGSREWEVHLRLPQTRPLPGDREVMVDLIYPLSIVTCRWRWIADWRWLGRPLDSFSHSLSLPLRVVFSVLPANHLTLVAVSIQSFYTTFLDFFRWILSPPTLLISLYLFQVNTRPLLYS
jgi:hypothetical protein